MAATRGAGRLESVHWLVRAFAGVGGVAVAAETYANGRGPIVATFAAVVGFGIVYALLLAGIRRYAQLLDRTAEDAERATSVEPREPAASEPPRLIRTRRRKTPERRLMAPGEPPRES